MLLEEQQQHPGELMGKIAEEMGLVTDEQLAQALAEQMSHAGRRLEGFDVAAEVLQTESPSRWRSSIASFPSSSTKAMLTVATCDPQNLAIQDELRTFLGYDIRLMVATEREIEKAIEKYYDAEAETHREDHRATWRTTTTQAGGVADRQRGPIDLERRRGDGRAARRSASC